MKGTRCRRGYRREKGCGGTSSSERQRVGQGVGGNSATLKRTAVRNRGGMNQLKKDPIPA